MENVLVAVVDISCTTDRLVVPDCYRAWIVWILFHVILGCCNYLTQCITFWRTKSGRSFWATSHGIQGSEGVEPMLRKKDPSFERTRITLFANFSSQLRY